MLTEQELHNLAMNIVGEAVVEALNWEFLLVNSQMKKDPQFVCIDKQGKKHFIIVRPIFMEVVRQKALENNADAYWAGVGLTQVHDKTAPLEKGKPYRVNFKGLLKIV